MINYCEDCLRMYCITQQLLGFVSPSGSHCSISSILVHFYHVALCLSVCLPVLCYASNSRMKVICDDYVDVIEYYVMGFGGQGHKEMALVFVLKLFTEYSEL